MFINVKTDNNGFRSINKQAMLDSLNHNSHNQLFRQWELYTPTQDLRNTYGDSVINGLDTIDLSVEFQMYGLSVYDSLIKPSVNSSWFKKHKNILLRNIANYKGLKDGLFSEVVYVAFLLDFNLPADANGETTLAEAETGGLYSYFTAQSSWKTRAHEFGHLLNLNHSFSETDKKTGKFSPNFRIPKYQTHNFMDYAKGINLTNMFYYAQWINIR